MIFSGALAVSRDLQVRVVICRWLSWLLRIKRPKTDVVGLNAAVPDTRQSDSHSHTNDNEVCRFTVTAFTRLWWNEDASDEACWLIGAMVCLLAAPRVQLFPGAGNGWPHNAFMPISYQLW